MSFFKTLLYSWGAFYSLFFIWSIYRLTQSHKTYDERKSEEIRQERGRIAKLAREQRNNTKPKLKVMQGGR